MFPILLLCFGNKIWFEAQVRIFCILTSPYLLVGLSFHSLSLPHSSLLEHQITQATWGGLGEAIQCLWLAFLFILCCRQPPLFFWCLLPLALLHQQASCSLWRTCPRTSSEIAHPKIGMWPFHYMAQFFQLCIVSTSVIDIVCSVLALV